MKHCDPAGRDIRTSIAINEARRVAQESAGPLLKLMSSKDFKATHCSETKEILTRAYGQLTRFDWDEVSRALQPTGISSPAFTRHAFYSAPSGLSFAIHRWAGHPSDPTASADSTVHNHLMNVASLVLHGELTHWTYPRITVEGALQRWVQSRSMQLTPKNQERFVEEEAYALGTGEFHRACASSVNATVTLFITGPKLYRGNIHIDSQGDVSLKVGQNVAVNLAQIREAWRTGPCDQATEPVSPLLALLAWRPADLEESPAILK